MEEKLKFINNRLKTMSINLGMIVGELDTLSRNKILDYESNRALNILFKELDGFEYILKFLSGYYEGDDFDDNRIHCRVPVIVDHIKNNNMDGLILDRS